MSTLYIMSLQDLIPILQIAVGPVILVMPIIALFIACMVCLIVSLVIFLGDINLSLKYGAVDLLGKSLRERAEALISIAHPDFRQELRRSYAETRRVVLPGTAEGH